MLKMPTDPASWSLSHVMHWLRWAANTFTSAAIHFKAVFRIRIQGVFWIRIQGLEKKI